VPIWWIGRELSSLFDQGDQILFIAAPPLADEFMVWLVEETARPAGLVWGATNRIIYVVCSSYDDAG
jgi:hypothetical protein